MGNKKIAVLGGGSWATAIVKILTENLETVNWWMRDQDCANHIMKFKHNPRYIQAIEFDVNRLNINTNIQEIVDDSDIPRSKTSITKINKKQKLKVEVEGDVKTVVLLG